MHLVYTHFIYASFSKKEFSLSKWIIYIYIFKLVLTMSLLFFGQKRKKDLFHVSEATTFVNLSVNKRFSKCKKNDCLEEIKSSSEFSIYSKELNCSNDLPLGHSNLVNTAGEIINTSKLFWEFSDSFCTFWLNTVILKNNVDLYFGIFWTFLLVFYIHNHYYLLVTSTLYCLM